VIGVVTAKLNAIRTAAVSGDLPQNVNFAIKASLLTSFLDGNRIAYRSGVAVQKLSPPDLADHAKAISVFVKCE
jgi:hypothetical protein